MDEITVPTTDVVDDLDKIDSYLGELHRRAAGVEGAGALVPITRSVLVNLIVLAHGADQMANTAASVAEIMGSHPCRAIIVDMGEAGPAGAPASISAVCGITERGERRLCGEIIELYVEDPKGDIAGMLLPMLVPDVPVVLWVSRSVSCLSPSLGQVIEVADSVLVDSRTFEDIGSELSTVLDACLRPGGERSVQDLAWVSLLPWRQLAAQQFDPPQARHFLPYLTRVAIRFTQGALSIPLLFASWLIDRTGMELLSVADAPHGNVTLLARQGEHDVSIELIGEPDAAPGRMRSVFIQADDVANAASFRIQSDSGVEVSVTEECVGICYPPLTVELPSAGEAWLVSFALEGVYRDPVYESAAAIAVQVCEKLRSSR